MRIFFALAKSPNPTFASNLWMANLHDPLVAMGHQVVHWDEGTQALFDVAPYSPEAVEPRARYSERFLSAVRRAHLSARVDLVLTYVSDSHLEPNAIMEVRERMAPIANFFCNNIHQFHLVKRNSRYFTVCLVPEMEAMRDYERVDATPIFFPMAANPDVYRPLDLPRRYEASFAGQRYADRAGNLLALREGGVDAHVFGQGWHPDGPAAGVGAATLASRKRSPLERLFDLIRRGRNPVRAAQDLAEWDRLRTQHAVALHPPATDEEYVALFSESAINLGFLVLGDTHRSLRPLRQVRLREFEAPMSGAFYLTEHLDEIGLHYEIGREVVTFRSRAELVERARYYLGHEEERIRVARAGFERARRDHTWTRRFEGLFAELRRRKVIR
jgi:spore maturation protein CgeB